jgi:hypothetical protein
MLIRFFCRKSGREIFSRKVRNRDTNLVFSRFIEDDDCSLIFEVAVETTPHVHFGRAKLGIIERNSRYMVGRDEVIFVQP